MLTVIAAAVAAIVGALAVGTTQSSPDATSPPTSPADTVTVTRANITPSITLDAVVAAQPNFDVPAPTRGVVRRSDAQTNQVIAADATLFYIDDQPVHPPADCLLTSWLTGAVTVPAGLPVATCTYPGFALQGDFPADAAYTMLTGALQARGQITNGPAPFDCTVLQRSAATTQNPPVPTDTTMATPGVSVLCAIPNTVRAITGLGALLVIRSTLVANALTLPRTAVAGSADTGTVNQIVNGRVTHTTVNLGATDGNLVQILSGLTAGDQVAATAPTLGAS